MSYWLDSDVFIQAKNKPYPFERVPQFWSFLSAQLDAGTIKASKLVYNELTRVKDDLANWCKQRKSKGLCISPSKEVQKRYSEIMIYVNLHYKQQDVIIFANSADGWVIAHALEDNGIVVSLEINKTTKTKIKVPTLCKAFGITCIDTFVMLKELDFKIP